MAICIARATPHARAIAIVVLLCVVFSAGRVIAQSAGLEKIQHIIVIYQRIGASTVCTASSLGQMASRMRVNAFGR
jgi:hypothetical protein